MRKFPFLEKELSWLSFNHRVLQEAQDKRVPILERLRFLGIYSSNMDEFYRVRVANVRRSVVLATGSEQEKRALKLLDDIDSKVVELQTLFDDSYLNLLQQLNDNNINLLNETQWLDNYYTDKLRRHIFPIILADQAKLPDYVNDDCTYLMVSMKKGEEYQYALVEVPSSDMPRFVQLPDEKRSNEKCIILLDNIIRHSMESIFKGFFEFDYISAYSMKLTRDADFDVSNEFSQSLYEQMSSALRKRLNAVPVRLVYDKKMPKHMLVELKKRLNITTNRGLIAGGRYHSFKDFIDFPNIGDRNLEYDKLPSMKMPEFDGYSNAFDAIKAQDILLYFPYHRFSYFTELLRQSAYDPKVRKIQICLYRVAKKSRVVDALIEAVKNGKEVDVNIELRARFDEEGNIMWADKLSNAGARVTFGIPSLKVHAKICLITREENGKTVQYANIGTGNFNESNAKIYTDFSLFTYEPRLTKEVAKVFEFLKYPYLRYRFRHLIVSPINSRSRLEGLIDAEIEAAQAGKENGITLKINNLVDKGLIEKLYEANNAGVKIELIIRGICSLVTGVKGYSENIRVISVVDRFLEHPRVSIFVNQGDPLVYISSADWMGRNIDERVEVGCPMFCPKVKQTIMDIIDIQLQDNVKARIIDSTQSNPYYANDREENIRSQVRIYDYLDDKNQQQQALFDAQQ